MASTISFSPLHLLPISMMNDLHMALRNPASFLKRERPSTTTLTITSLTTTSDPALRTRLTKIAP
ncbi:MAG: hypothetical protein Q9180_004571, partial [Flavoplaca navasiana]